MQAKRRNKKFNLDNLMKRNNPANDNNHSTLS